MTESEMLERLKEIAEFETTDDWSKGFSVSLLQQVEKGYRLSERQLEIAGGENREAHSEQAVTEAGENEPGSKAANNESSAAQSVAEPESEAPDAPLTDLEMEQIMNEALDRETEYKATIRRRLSGMDRTFGGRDW